MSELEKIVIFVNGGFEYAPIPVKTSKKLEQKKIISKKDRMEIIGGAG